jgi:hypothetical protein
MWVKRYLEEVVAKIAPDDSAKLIRSESNRLNEARKLSLFANNPLIRHLGNRFGIKPEVAHDCLTKATTLDDVITKLTKSSQQPTEATLDAMKNLFSNMLVLRDLNDARATLGLSQFEVPKPA